MVTSVSRRRSSSTPLHPQAPHGGGGVSCDDSVDSATTCTGILVSSSSASNNEEQCKEEQQQQQLVSSSSCSSSERSAPSSSSLSQMSNNNRKLHHHQRSRSNSFPTTVSSSSSSRIRTKYLQRLGVVAPSTPTCTASSTTTVQRKKIEPLPQSVVINNSNNIKRRRRKERSSSLNFEILKNDNGQKDDTLCVDSNPLSPASSSPLTSSSSVRFQPCVKVQTVPARDDYSTNIRDLLWMTSNEMEEMIHRNSIEFASENWDWRCVAEEDDFVFINEKHGYIHPVHAYNSMMMRRCNLQRQFCMVMSANSSRQHHR